LSLKKLKKAGDVRVVERVAKTPRAKMILRASPKERVKDLRLRMERVLRV